MAMELTSERTDHDLMKALAYLAPKEESQPAPTKIAMARRHCIWTVAVGKNHTATIIMDRDTHSALGTELIKVAIAERQENIGRLEGDLANAKAMDADEHVARIEARIALVKGEIAALEAKA